MAGISSAAMPYLPDSPKRFVVEASYDNVNHSWIDYETDNFTEALNKLAELAAQHEGDVSYTIYDRRTQRRIRITDLALQR
jgi:hypothetical protein